MIQSNETNHRHLLSSYPLPYAVVSSAAFQNLSFYASPSPSCGFLGQVFAVVASSFGTVFAGIVAVVVDWVVDAVVEIVAAVNEFVVVVVDDGVVDAVVETAVVVVVVDD